MESSSSSVGAGRIRLGLIGCGGIVENIHAPAYKALRAIVEVCAVADPVPANRDRIGTRFGVPAGARFADHRDLLAQASVDAVVIATPHHLHVQHVIDSAEAGVAIISEKPMATSLEEAERILAAVSQHHVPYTVVHNLLFSLPMQAARNELQASLGAPIFGRSQSLFLKAEDFHRDPNHPGQRWRATSAAGGGCLIDTAYHEIYTVEALIGSPVRYVEARVRTARFPIDVDDLAVLLLEHENGCVSTVSSGWCTAVLDGGRWCEAHTAKGTIRVHHRRKDPVMLFTPDGRGWRSIAVPGLESDPKLVEPKITGHLGFMEAAFTALRQGQAPAVTGEDARHNLAIIAAARQASTERRAVEVRY